MVKLDNGNPAHYFMSVDAILSVEDGQEIKAGAVIARTRGPDNGSCRLRRGR